MNRPSVQKMVGYYATATFMHSAWVCQGQEAGVGREAGDVPSSLFVLERASVLMTL